MKHCWRIFCADKAFCLLMVLWFTAILLTMAATLMNAQQPQQPTSSKLYRLLDFKQGVAISCKDGLKPSVQKTDSFVIVDCQHVLGGHE